MVSVVITTLEKSADLGFEINAQILNLQQIQMLQYLVPSLGLALYQVRLDRRLDIVTDDA